MKDVLFKVVSGRWLLTVTAAFVFAWCSIAGLLDAATISALLGSIFIAYFGRKDRDKES